jgi:hypothetical protein
MNGTRLTPDQAWQALLSQLQREIPRSIFEARLKRVEGVSSESGVFTIWVNDEETRAWLSDRLTSTVCRGLRGILDAEVSVRFALGQPDRQPDGPQPEPAFDPAAAWQRARSDPTVRAAAAEHLPWLEAAAFLAHYAGAYLVGLPTAQACEWAAERLAGPLAGALDGTAAGELPRVQFVYAPSPPAAEPGVGPSLVPGSASQEEISDPEGTPESPPLEIQLAPVCASLREIITRPKSVVVVPAYLLRWLPYLGADQGWLLVAMRQAFYQAHGQKVKDANCGQTFTVNRRQIARWSGLGENSVWQLLNRLDEPNQAGNFLSWFLAASPGGRGRARRYTFRLDMPLTPGDVSTLRDWLEQDGLRHHPLETLQRALSMQPRDLLPFPPPPPTPADRLLPPQPQTLPELVMSCAGLPRSDPRYLPTQQLAEQLLLHLQSPSDNLVLTHYFLLEWLEKLGRVAGWLVAILRDRGYIDHTRGIRRDRVRLEGGYAELSQLLGISERQVRSWLPPLAEMAHQRPPVETPAPRSAWEQHQAKRALVSQFLEKEGQVDRSGGRATRYEFHLRLEDPLTPEHQAIYTALESLLHAAFSSGDWAPVEDLCAALEQHLQASQRVSDNPLPTRSAFQTSPLEVAARSNQAAEASLRAINKPRCALHTTSVSLEARNAQLKALMIQHLNPKALQEIQHLLHQQHAGFHSDAGEEKGGGAGASPATLADGAGEAQLDWDWEQLFGFAGLALPERAELCASERARRQFLAQALYGYEQRAAGAGRGIRAPFRFAAARWRDRPPPEYLELAELPPPHLAGAIQQGLRHPAAAQLSGAAWRVVRSLRAQDFLQVILQATRPVPSSRQEFG